MCKKIKVLVTGAGAPGIKGTVYSLKNNWDNRDVHVVGTDIQDEVVGKYICDEFYTIAPAKFKEEYLNSLLEVCIKTETAVLLPQNTMELGILSENIDLFEKIGVKVVISNKSSIDVANNKFALMKVCEQLGIPTGKHFLVSNFEELKFYAEKLGWPNKNVVVKPPISNGQRGVRIIDEQFDEKKAFYSQKPSDMIIKMERLKSILGDEFPELIVTEYLPGKEFTVDVFRFEDELTIVPRVRLKMRSGITFEGLTDFNEQIIEATKLIVDEIPLQYCFGFQFKLSENNIPMILESNPRIQGTMILATLAGANIIYASVKAALGEPIVNFEIDWNTRFHRYWGGVGVTADKEITFI